MAIPPAAGTFTITSYVLPAANEYFTLHGGERRQGVAIFRN